MILITDDLGAQLLANGAADTETDHVPVLNCSIRPGRRPGF
ncbi:hypothetical protein [Mesorhizobium sp.]|nr:hypothetical protein [Mesorhizobium sp.]